MKHPLSGGRKGKKGRGREKVNPKDDNEFVVGECELFGLEVHLVWTATKGHQVFRMSWALKTWTASATRSS